MSRPKRDYVRGEGSPGPSRGFDMKKRANSSKAEIALAWALEYLLVLMIVSLLCVSAFAQSGSVGRQVAGSIGHKIHRLISAGL